MKKDRKVKFSDEIYGGEQVLKSPCCDYEFTHQESVRENDDGDIIIRFSCEGCEEISELCIHQHKGCTVVSWLDRAEPKKLPNTAIIKELRYSIIKAATESKYPLRIYMSQLTKDDLFYPYITYIKPKNRDRQIPIVIDDELSYGSFVLDEL